MSLEVIPDDHPEREIMMTQAEVKSRKLTKKILSIAGDLGTATLRVAEYLTEMEDFGKCSGSSRPEAHHYGDGGLIVHTYEVIDTCLEMAGLYPQYGIDEVELFLAALFHDSGKMHDYEKKNVKYPFFGVDQAYGFMNTQLTMTERSEWTSTDHKDKIHHIQRSAFIWRDAVATATEGFRNRYTDPVCHAILAHHGQRAWGSPVTPRTRVAWLLHLCDGISARLYDVDTFYRE